METTAVAGGDDLGERPRQATVRDVAREANVSTATVSRVTSNKGYPVSAAARARVLEAVSRLGYSPNDLARSLLQERTFTVGVVVPDLSNPHHPDIVRGVEETAAANGYSVQFCSTDNEPDRLASYLDQMASKRVDGIILAGGGLDPDRALGAIGPFRMRTIVVGRYSNSVFPSVESDNRAAGQLATRHILELGHRRLGAITGPATATASADRLAGALEVLKEFGLTSRATSVVESDFSAEGGYAAAKKLLKRKSPPTAIIASNDAMAIGAMAAAADMGLGVPNDLAVMGYDDIVTARFLRPSLTTIALPTHEMGSTAMSLLMQLIDGEAVPQRTILGVDLVVRQSTTGR
ncbi:MULTISPECIES: LacI family DNA-binding transcriptional regulator [unclassified Arthrobacter]|uniref:LacI family DNA-binding transcriptional regulator n=1 Tax=unclassified Arthrobacter TaxID=235627 RepID=UPI001C8634F5|nr:LacI family DNA-binding transcriptional regulator [Arthrobacter sp. MAHUQ-56]MBX7444616.1 LacI family transcriptional regulator [Arthrobacter sp. MAHUQ-56]